MIPQFFRFLHGRSFSQIKSLQHKYRHFCIRASAEPVMTQLENQLAHPVTIIGNRAACLGEILRDDVNLAVWERSQDFSWGGFVTEFCNQAGNLERFVSLEPGQSAATALPRWALDIAGARNWIDDVDELIEMYQCLFEPEAIGLRIHVLADTMCPDQDRGAGCACFVLSPHRNRGLPELCYRPAEAKDPLPEQPACRSDPNRCLWRRCRPPEGQVKEAMRLGNGARSPRAEMAPQD